ncbi:regulator of chromosome condensation RCC1 repeat protein [Nitzschia inconspicua]|uniref:Regulator of chromosome condensation RCC1 repeat protein n=1 Tax=Nitzschia inconspicua TaxID=303405 RepID=A0A9K3LA14_9STRA|nr:regulator of chromosome condensation RCC1 repeat protein [Nitzschia inconspicua]KAG7358223.1 regulator of chromosome condensation RCC1 repeat protein [Nitzschia inconspicua]
MSKENESIAMLVGFGKNYFHNMGSAEVTTLNHQAIDGTSDIEAFVFNDKDRTLVPPWEQDDDPLVDVQCTVTSSYFLTKSGKVYTCGTLHGNVTTKIAKLTIALPLKCEQIATGRHFCLAKMEGGLAVCSWGAGHFGQLGLGSDSLPFVKHPTVVESLLPHVVGSPVVAVAAGHWHSMVVTQAGRVFAFGCNRNGQCGSKQTKEPPTICSPKPVSFDSVPSPTNKATTTSSATSTSSSSSTSSTTPRRRLIKIERIAAGRSHSVALDQSGQVYCWGANQYGQCGVITRRRGGVPQAKHVEALAKVKIVRIAAGECHTLALTGGGRVFAWGGGYEGQLGIGMNVLMNPKPKLVGDLDFLAIEAGREWKTQQRDTSDTLENSQQITSFSSQDASRSTQSSPIVPRIIEVHAKGNSSVAVSNAGHVYAWGCNDVGNLGLPKPDPATLTYDDPGQHIHKTSTLRTVQTFSFDSSHNVALPQRLDSIRHLHITSVGMSPTFLWCMGKVRRGKDDPEVGRTLYEVQEAKRQKSLHVHYERVLKTVETGTFSATTPSISAPQDSSSSTHLEKTGNASIESGLASSNGSQPRLLDPPCIKERSEEDFAREEEGWEDGSTSQHSHEEKTEDTIEMSGDVAVIPKQRSKRFLFSPKKLVKAIVRRASTNTSKSDSIQQLPVVSLDEEATK